MTASAFVHQLAPIDPAHAQGDQKAILDQALQQVGFIPHMYANMAQVPALLDAYLYGYRLLRTRSTFTPVELELVFLAISQANECGYCTAAHSMMADKVAKVPPDILQAVRQRQALPDTRLAALHGLTQDLVASRARPCPQRVAAFLAAGFQEAQILEIILAIGVKTLSNYANHAFDTPLDERFAPWRI